MRAGAGLPHAVRLPNPPPRPPRSGAGLPPGLWPPPTTCTRGSRPSSRSGSLPSRAPERPVHASHRDMERVAIVAAVRTPIGRFLGAFAELSAADLGVAATTAALERARLAPADV